MSAGTDTRLRMIRIPKIQFPDGSKIWEVIPQAGYEAISREWYDMFDRFEETGGKLADDGICLSIPDTEVLAQVCRDDPRVREELMRLLNHPSLKAHFR